MAIAYGDQTLGATTPTGGHLNNMQNATLVAPAVSGSDTVMVFGVAINGTVYPAPDTYTYDSVSLGAPIVNVVISYVRVCAWVLANPGSAKTFALHFPTGTEPDNVQMSCTYYTGVDQSTPNRTPASNSGTVNPATVDVTNSASGDLIAGVFGLDDTTLTNGFTQARMGGGQTFRGVSNNSTDEVQIAVCDEPGASGTVTHSWDFVNDAGNGWAVGAIPLIPSAASPQSFTAPVGSLTVAGVAIGVARPPDAPTNLQATSSENQQVPLTWTAPTNDGNSPLTDYIVQYRQAP